MALSICSSGSLALYIEAYHTPHIEARTQKIAHHLHAHTNTPLFNGKSVYYAAFFLLCHFHTPKKLEIFKQHTRCHSNTRTADWSPSLARRHISSSSDGGVRIPFSSQQMARVIILRRHFISATCVHLLWLFPGSR